MQEITNPCLLFIPTIVAVMSKFKLAHHPYPNYCERKNVLRSFREGGRRPSRLRFGIQHYMNLYNFRRIHSALQYRTPGEGYFGTCNRLIAGYRNSKVFTPIF